MPLSIQGIIKKYPTLITGILVILLVGMFFLFCIQWFLIQELFGFASEQLQSRLIKENPDGVNPEEVKVTFGRVKEAFAGLPFTYIAGKLKVGKVKPATEYATDAGADEVWTSAEVNQLLQMMNIAVGYEPEKGD